MSDTSENRLNISQDSTGENELIFHTSEKRKA